MKRGPYKGRTAYARKPSQRWTDEFQQQHIIDNSTEDANGCMNWNLNRNNLGYGMKSYKGKWSLAHRVSYALFNEPIPDGLNVLHDCDNPACVAPHHLFVGTQKDNQQDMIRKGRNAKTRNRAKGSGIWLSTKGTRWYKRADGTPGERRLKPADVVPDGWVPGRNFDPAHRRVGA